MTAMSWNSSTENELCPARVCINPFSFKVCSTIAVDESDRMRPTASADDQASPSPIPIPVIAAAVRVTCSPPSPRIGARMRHSSDGSSSSPTRNSIITTPNSAKCMMSCPRSPTKSSANGPMATPAIR